MKAELFLPSAGARIFAFVYKILTLGVFFSAVSENERKGSRGRFSCSKKLGYLFNKMI